MARVKFGVFLPFYALQVQKTQDQYSLIRNLVHECEELGYDSVWLDDHMMYKSFSILESWTVLSALAETTSKIKLGTMVSCPSHRNPALLAKASATLDVLSRGRLELGVGSGAQENEHQAYGFGYPKIRVRAEILREAIEVIKNLWTKEEANFHGKHFDLKNAFCQPKPMQKPHPPIVIGGSGEKFTLPITARYADRFDWGYLPSIDKYKQKLESLKNHCKEIGRDFEKIEKSCWPSGQIVIAENQREFDQVIAVLKPKKTPLKKFLESTLAGRAEECIERLEEYSDLGVTYFMLYFGDLPSSFGLRLFAQRVVKKFR